MLPGRPPVWPGPMYRHRFYFASPQSLDQISAFHYRLAKRVPPALRRFMAWDKFAWNEFGTRSDTPLCLRFHATNTSIDLGSEDVVLVSDRGLRLPLTLAWLKQEHGQGFAAWEMPTLLTNRGKYTLTVNNQPLATIVYD